VADHAYGLRVPDEQSQRTGEKIRALRSAKSWSQHDLAAKAGVTRQTVSGWENGTGIKGEHLETIARLFGVPPASIGVPWDPEAPRPRHYRPKSHLSSRSHVAAPPPPPTGAVMGSGEPALFEQVEGAWKLLRTDEERRAFVEHVRGFVHLSTAPEATRKKAAR
jgi:transcriptional regulator with XRE-family HTH domain